MVADLREMQENQRVSEIRIGKLELNQIACAMAYERPSQ